MRRDIGPAEEAARLAGLQDRHGYRAVKFRIGRECGHDQDEWPGRTEAVVPAVRGAVAKGTALLVDANSCYTPAKAIEVGLMLQDEGVRHFEEPCPYWEQEWTTEVTAALDLDVTGGEQDCLLTTWRRMLEPAGRGRGAAGRVLSRRPYQDATAGPDGRRGRAAGVGAVRNTARVRPGSRVAVFGCGGVGLNAVQGARLAGATRIVAIDLTEEKLDLARRFGATDVVHAGQEDLAGAIHRLMDGVD
jgi:hypothetical protein